MRRPQGLRGACIGLALVLALSLVSVADARTSVLTPELDRQLKAAGKSELLLVMVHGTDAPSAVRAVHSRRLLPLETWERVGIVPAMGTPAQIRSLDGLPGITRLEGDAPMELMTDTSHAATRGRDAIKGFTATSAAGPANLPGVDGRGVSIAVIDGGVDGTQPMFQQDGKSKVVRNMKLACSHPLLAMSAIFEGLPDLPPSSCPNDYDAGSDPWIDFTAINDTDTIALGGHGTHVASTAAGVPVKTANGRKLNGAAPGAKVIGLGMGAFIFVYGGASAMNWVVENHRKPCGAGVSKSACPPIKVVNNSWGGGGSEFDKNSALVKLSNALIDDDVTVVWSAGNSGGDGSSSMVDGDVTNPRPGLIAVANYNDGDVGDRNHELHPTSSRGREGHPTTYPDISAPGSAVTAACPAYMAICAVFGEEDPDLSYNALTGTSMAAPHVAGIVAQLLQANPRLTPGSIEYILEDTAHRFASGGKYEPDPRNRRTPTSFDKGHGLVDVVAAVAAAYDVEPPGARPLCTSGGPVLVDRPGDATHVASDLAVAGAPSPATLDITRARVGWSDEADVLKVFLDVVDLEESNPPPAPGISFEVEFAYENAVHTLSASRHDALGEFFTLDGVDVTGRFDLNDDYVVFTVDKADVKAAGLTPLQRGDALSDFVARSRYDSGVVLAPLADEATGRCPFTIGFGAVPPPPSVVPPIPPDGVISTSKPRHTWTGGPVTNLHSVDDTVIFFECSAPSGEACHDERVKVSVPADGGTLDVSIAADVPVNDFDLYVLDPSGKEIGSSVNFGTINPEAGTLEESVSVPIEKSGVYTIRVIAFATFESTYEGAAVLR